MNKTDFKELTADLQSCQRENEQLIAERDAALKACAEMREVLTRHHEWSVYQSKRNQLIYAGSLRRATEHALSTDCGKGYISAKELEPILKLAWDLHHIIGNQSTLGEIISRLERLLQPTLFGTPK